LQIRIVIVKVFLQLSELSISLIDNNMFTSISPAGFTVLVIKGTIYDLF